MSDFTFESGMQALEALVKALESGQMGLEESFDAYAKAIALRDKLTAILDDGTEVRFCDLMCFAEKVHNRY